MLASLSDATPSWRLLLCHGGCSLFSGRLCAVRNVLSFGSGVDIWHVVGLCLRVGALLALVRLKTSA